MPQARLPSSIDRGQENKVARYLVLFPIAIPCTFRACSAPKSRFLRTLSTKNMQQRVWDSKILDPAAHLAENYQNWLKMTASQQRIVWTWRCMVRSDGGDLRYRNLCEGFAWGGELPRWISSGPNQEWPFLTWERVPLCCSGRVRSNIIFSITNSNRPAQD